MATTADAGGATDGTADGATGLKSGGSVPGGGVISGEPAGCGLGRVQGADRALQVRVPGDDVGPASRLLEHMAVALARADRPAIELQTRHDDAPGLGRLVGPRHRLADEDRELGGDEPRVRDRDHMLVRADDVGPGSDAEQGRDDERDDAGTTPRTEHASPPPRTRAHRAECSVGIRGRDRPPYP